MTDFSLNWLRELGSLGLFGAMFIEGTSLPFPGIVVVFAYGYMLSYDLFYTSKVAMGMSIMYCVASLIPYFMGNKLMGLIFKKQNKGLEKAKALFNRYGFWSVAFFRPFGLGNYISYVAGMSNMGLVHYLFLTFLGIYPWAFVVLSLGKYFKGNYEAVISFYYKNSVFIYGTAILILFTIICLYIEKRKK